MICKQHFELSKIKNRASELINNCEKNNIVHSIERWFINVNFIFFLLILLFFYLVLAFIYLCHWYFLEFGILGFQTHKFLAWWPTSTLASITHWSHTKILYLELHAIAIKHCFGMQQSHMHFSFNDRPEIKEIRCFHFQQHHQGSTNCMHSDEHAYNVRAKRFSRARNYVHVNQSEYLQVVYQCCLR